MSFQPQAKAQTARPKAHQKKQEECFSKEIGQNTEGRILLCSCACRLASFFSSSGAFLFACHARLFACRRAALARLADTRRGAATSTQAQGTQAARPQGKPASSTAARSSRQGIARPPSVCKHRGQRAHLGVSKNFNPSSFLANFVPKLSLDNSYVVLFTPIGLGTACYILI